jgi:uncharacterized protein
LGFHAQRLEVAELSEEAWVGLGEGTVSSDGLEAVKSWSHETKLLSKSTPATKKSYVKSLSINVTQVCNLHCVYCAAGGDGTYGAPTKKIAVEKTLPQIQWLIERVPTDGSFSINFLGGEPLLYPEALSAIGEYAKSLASERNIRVSFNVVTNGTLFTEKSIAELKKINCAITLSLDGPAEINDLVRPGLSGKGVTLKILEGLQFLLRDRKNLGSIGVQAVFGQHNTEVIKAYVFFRELGLDWYEFNYDQTNSDSISSSKFEKELKQVAEIAVAHGTTSKETELRKIKFFDQIFSYLDGQKGTQNFCGSGSSYLVIDAQNRAFTCPWEVNDLKMAVGLGSDLNLEKIQHLKTSQIEANNCGSCWARYLCGGGCMYAHKKVTGNKHKPDPNYCERTRNLISTAIMHYESFRGLAPQEGSSYEI